ncbi:MAG: hypothetical protein ACLFQB_15155 [Chitinispirillaceae bacterium]
MAETESGRMDGGKAFWAGVLGGMVMIILATLARIAGIPVYLSMMLGTLFGLSPGIGTWFLGFLVHLFISGLIALLYGLGFEYVTHRASMGIGALVSLVHIVAAGFVFGLIPYIHPAVPGVLIAPGVFMSRTGTAGVVLFIIIHILYGMIVGSLYGAGKE